MTADVLIHGVRFAADKAADGWIAITGQRISAIGHGPEQPQCATAIDAEGALALPGVIDCHVHFREPGLTDKADIASESRAAVAGGVTSFLDMPNTNPPTVDIERWEEKMEIARHRSVANYGFFIGATNDNIEELKRADYSRIPGVKLFMGSSTGNMLVDDDTTLASIFREVEAIVAVHAEDQDIIAGNTANIRKKFGNKFVFIAQHAIIRSVEACYKCTARAVALAKKYDHRLHICHLTTASELCLLQTDLPIDQRLITSEVSPHHLLWSSADYAKKGARIKMNPAVKSAADRRKLRHALATGLIDMVATDHAPHLWADKQGDVFHAASGAPLVQFALPVMLNLFDETTVERTMCHNPATIYGITDRGHLAVGCFADITLVKEVEPYEVTDEDVLSKCRWTPLDGVTLRHKVMRTIVNGKTVYADGTFAPDIVAMPLNFAH